MTDGVIQLEDATEQSVNSSRSRSNVASHDADNQIARMRRILADIDNLEDEFEKIKRIRDKIKQLRANVDQVSERLDRSRASGHSSGARPRR